MISAKEWICSRRQNRPRGECSVARTRSQRQLRSSCETRELNYTLDVICYTALSRRHIIETHSPPSRRRHRGARKSKSKGKENLLQGTGDQDHAFTEKTGSASGSVCMGLSASPRSSIGMYSARMPRTWSRIWRCVRFQ